MTNLVLMSCLEKSLKFAGSNSVLILEHPHCGGGPRALLLPVLLQPRSKGQLTAGVEVESDGDTVVTRGHQRAVADPGEGEHGQQVRPQLHHHHVLGRVRHRDGAVVTHPGQLGPVPGEADGVDPASAVGRVGELGHQVAHRHPLSPLRGTGLGLDLLDVARVDTDLKVGGAGGQEDVVGVPVQTGHGGLERLLDVLGHPPVLLLLVVADGDDLGPAAHRELVLVGRPADAGGGAVDPQQHQRVLPLTIRSLRRKVCFNVNKC